MTTGEYIVANSTPETGTALEHLINPLKSEFTVYVDAYSANIVDEVYSANIIDEIVKANIIEEVHRANIIEDIANANIIDEILKGEQIC